MKVGDVAGAKVALVALENKFPLLVKFLGHEDDDVSGTVAEFSQAYIGLLKQTVPLEGHHKDSLKVSAMQRSLQGRSKDTLNVCVISYLGHIEGRHFSLGNQIYLLPFYSKPFT